MTKKQLTWEERLNKESPILMEEGTEPLTERVAEYIGCVNDEQCGHSWQWRRCGSCIDQARGVIELIHNFPA